MSNFSLTDPFAPGSGFSALEREVLPLWMPRCRWFGGKARSPQRFDVIMAAALSDRRDAARLLLVQVEYADASRDTYFVPLQVSRGEAATLIATEYPQAIAARIEGPNEAVLHDALCDERFRAELLDLMTSGRALESAGGTVTGLAGSALGELLGGETEVPSRLLRVEQSNSSIIFGDRLFMKIFRKLEEGLNPDAEILRYLTERRHFAHAPAYGGGIEFRASNEAGRLLALALSVVPNAGDAWAFALGEVAQCYRRVIEHRADASALPLPSLFGEHTWPDFVERMIGPSFLERA
ncbi:MAG TPA: hypothetical protein VGO90_12785, partial [Chthoniobacteraceae bacterium]|nr:hypothetical protein [Chthoniobacteraceae bacterium]